MHGDTSNMLSTHCDIIKMPHLAHFVRGFLCYENFYLHALVNLYQLVRPNAWPRLRNKICHILKHR